MTQTVQLRRAALMERLWAVIGPAFDRAARDNFDRPWSASAR